MEKCLHCNKALQHVSGRKQKSFCDVNCRNKYFYAKRRKAVEDAKILLSKSEVKVVPPISSDQAIALHNAENADQHTEKSKLRFPKPLKRAKKEELSDSELSADIIFSSPPVAYDSPRRPRNLEELKLLCPADLTGLDRSQWISKERQKYGI